MTLTERLEALADAGGNTPPVDRAPAGWNPGIVYEPDGTRIVTSGPVAETDDPTPVLAAMGITIPDGFRARLAEVRHDPAAWTRSGQGEDAVTVPVVRCRWIIEPDVKAANVDELLAAIGSRKKAPAPTTQDAAGYVWLVGDLQLGKSDGDGTAGTVGHFLHSLDHAVDRYKALRKRGQAGPVLLAWAGDCIEGGVSQGGRLISRLDLTITEMVRVYRRLMAEQVTAFSDLSDDVTVAVVPGNHDEAIRIGDQSGVTRYDDSWAIDGASAVADVMAAKGRDIAWSFPARDGLHLTLEHAGTRIGILHGHQTRGKMQSWLANKALDRDAIGTCDLVLSGHFHTLRLEQFGPTTWMQTGALDGGSTWWSHRGGLNNPPASITLLTRDGAWNALEVL